MFIIKDLRQIPDTLLQLAQWHQSEWSQLNPGETLEQRIDRMQDYLNKDFIPSTFVAIDHTVLGSAAIVKNDMATRKKLSPWLASVYVSPDRRGRGIGRKLVQHVMSCAKNRAYDKLYLFTADQQKFYESLGWQTFDIEHYHGQQVSLMQIKL
jgi:N-acetylglutamate synthase-like GNAT family acetyltransferase